MAIDPSASSGQAIDPSTSSGQALKSAVLYCCGAKPPGVGVGSNVRCGQWLRGMRRGLAKDAGNRTLCERGRGSRCLFLG